MTAFNYDFRPSYYWDHPDPVAAILSQVKGQKRREIIRRALLETPWEQLPEALIEGTVSGSLQAMFERLDPTWMGGEYLPDYLPGEVEIARVVLSSTTEDVYSLRARRDCDIIRYRMVDEYETVFQLPQTDSQTPLTLREVIAMIDRTSWDGLEARDFTDALRDDAGAEDPEEGIDFVRVTSEIYSDLEPYYEQRAQAWLRRAKRPGDSREAM